MGRGAPARAISFRAASVGGLTVLGRALGTALSDVSGNHSSLLIGLDGELGTGKTTLAAGALAAMGVQSRVTSPTYGLVHPYTAELPGNGTAIEILHVDLYRLTQPAELDELGLDEGPGVARAAIRRVVLVEWFERAGGRLGTPDIAVRLQHQAVGRRVELQANSVAGERIVRMLGEAEVVDLDCEKIRNTHLKL